MRKSSRKNREESENRWRGFFKPPFLISTFISGIALWVAIKSCSQSDVALDLSRQTFIEQYEERLSIEGQLRLARNDSFYYWAGDQETLATSLPIVTDYYLMNNSRSPATITRIEYWRCDMDTTLYWLPGSALSRGEATQTIPLTVESGGALHINDTLEIFVNYVVHPLPGIPGYFRPASFKRKPLSWLDCPIDWTLKSMLLSEVCFPISRSNTGYNIFNIDSVCSNNRSFLRTTIVTSRGTEIEFDYWYFSAKTAMKQHRSSTSNEQDSSSRSTDKKR